MKTLKKINHDFDTPVGEIGVTIRKGLKWSRTVNVGEYISLSMCKDAHTGDCSKEQGCQHKGTGMILGWWCGTLQQLPPILLSMEHNIKARDKNELIAMLKKGYGDINEINLITALIYLRTSSPETFEFEKTGNRYENPELLEEKKI